MDEYLVFDLETQLSAAEVGGWGNIRNMKMSCGVLYSSVTNEFETYFEKDMVRLIERLANAKLVVGFNTIGFDYQVLSGYCDFDFRRLPSLDLLVDLYRQIGVRVSLDSVAGETLGETKSADGLQALSWWKEGRLEEIAAYCRQDVLVTKNIYCFGRENGFVRYRRKNGVRGKVKVDW